MRIKSFILLLILIGFSACNKEHSLTTGIKGVVFRGPINPVAIEGQLNEAPFSALFFVYNLQNTKITTFTSTLNGEYFVLLLPGKYRIIPDKSAPLLNPEFQVKEISVNTSGITSLNLNFDTGIR